MTNYTWTDNMMQSGSSCDVDKVADNLMHLKYNANEAQVNSLGTVSGGTITLTKDNFHTVTFSGASTIALPTGLTSGIVYNCTLLITMSSIVTITMPSGVIWTYGVAPTLASTSAKYRLTFETLNGGATWYGYSTQLGA